MSTVLLLAGLGLIGLLGAILAIPVGAVVQVFVQVIFRNRLGPMAEDLAPIDAGRSLTSRGLEARLSWRDRLRAPRTHVAMDPDHDDE